MESTEITVKGRKYTLNRQVLVLALIHADRDVERTRHGLLRLVAAYDRYLHRRALRRGA